VRWDSALNLSRGSVNARLPVPGLRHARLPASAGQKCASTPLGQEDTHMAGLQYRFHSETESLDELARSAASGRFVSLADGVVHFEQAGSDAGQPVVLVHGFSVPYYVWDPTFAALSQAGFLTLRYDLYGRGLSDRPETSYNLDLFDRQLLNLVTALGLRTPVDLVGLSMGGPIAVTFADRHPTLVRRLVLVDPAGFPLREPLAVVVKTPLLGELLMDFLGEKLLVSGQSKDFYHPERFQDYPPRYRPYARYRGFRRALLSTLRADTLQDSSVLFRRVGLQRRPTLLFWGREDKTIPFETHRLVLDAMPHAEFHAIEEARHVPHFERPDVVNPILIEFLRR
jgi:pimeloyl-ACP methyl ester carboxylesterase